MSDAATTRPGHKQRQKQRHIAERHARVQLLAERLLPLVTDPVDGLCGSESDERVDWSAVHPSVDPVASGQVSVERGQRKREQIESFRVILDTLVGDDTLQVVDFCCGSGNFGLALAALLPRCSFVLLDRNAHAIDLVRQRATEAGLSNVSAVVANAEDFTGTFDVAIAMHACSQHVSSGPCPPDASVASLVVVPIWHARHVACLDAQVRQRQRLRAGPGSPLRRGVRDGAVLRGQAEAEQRAVASGRRREHGGRCTGPHPSSLGGDAPCVH